MGYIKFKNKNKIYEATVHAYTKHIVIVNFLDDEVEKNVSGFEYSCRSDFKTVLGKYYDYKTISRVDNNYLYLSNDGSVYPSLPERPESVSLGSRVLELEDKNEELIVQIENTKNQLTDAQLALCDVYELIGG